MTLLRFLAGVLAGAVTWRFAAPFLAGAAWSLLADALGASGLDGREAWVHGASIVISILVIAGILAVFGALAGRAKSPLPEPGTKPPSFAGRFLRGLVKAFVLVLPVTAFQVGFAQLPPALAASLFLAVWLVVAIAGGLLCVLLARALDGKDRRVAGRGALLGYLGAIAWFQPVFVEPRGLPERFAAVESALVSESSPVVEEALAHGDEVLFASASGRRRPGLYPIRPDDRCVNRFMREDGDWHGAYRKAQGRFARWPVDEGVVDKEQWLQDLVIATCAVERDHPPTYLARGVRNTIRHRRLRLELDTCEIDDEFPAPPWEREPSLDVKRCVRQLTGLLCELEPTDEQVVLRRAVDDEPFAEIAESLALPSADAARKRFARAVAEVGPRMPADCAKIFQ